MTDGHGEGRLAPSGIYNRTSRTGGARMKTRFLFFSPLRSSGLVAGACGGDDDDGSGSTIDASGGAGGADAAAGGGADAAVSPDGYQAIITTSWTLPPPNSPKPDKYFC